MSATIGTGCGAAQAAASVKMLLVQLNFKKVFCLVNIEVTPVNNFGA